MADQKPNKITKYRKPLNINIGMLIFGVILIYTLIGVFNYFTAKHITGYEVKIGSLSSNNIYTGLALRSEEVITSADAGYINYYAREGERVAVGDLVYTVDESGRLADYINSDEGGENSLSSEDLNELKTQIISFTNNFDRKHFSTVYDFKYGVKGTVLKLANYQILSSIDAINRSGAEGLVNYCRAPQSGIVVYSIDGYENLTPEQVTSDLMNPENYEKKQLINNELIASGDPVYKLSVDEDWSLIIPMEAEKAAELASLEYIKVKFLKNQFTSWAEASSVTGGTGESCLQLVFNNSMLTYSTDRFLDVELSTEEKEGLKIPNSAIVEREFFIVPKEYVTKGGNSNAYGVLREAYTEEGAATTEFIETTIYNETEEEYYLDDPSLRIGDYLLLPDSTDKYALSKRGSLIGVYNINKGYADFKQINILYQNEEYSIVESNTDYGLREYDYIVLDTSTVNENELIYE